MQHAVVCLNTFNQSPDLPLVLTLWFLAGAAAASLKADTGKYLARCRNCVPGAENEDAAFVHLDSAAEPFAQWTIAPAGAEKVSLQITDYRLQITDYIYAHSTTSGVQLWK
jgi:hypothetical protein